VVANATPTLQLHYVPSTCPHCHAAIAAGAVRCPACGTPIPLDADTIPDISSNQAAAAWEAQTRQELVGALGNASRIEGLLGQGGFGYVYRATELNLARQVAIKVLRAEMSFSASAPKRFLREAMAAARLRHPNIMPVYHVGEDGDLAWIIMPIIQGETLRQRLDRAGPIPEAEVVKILQEAASALTAAHEAGLVHRDIKPENMMLEAPEGRLILMDFGIAKVVDDDTVHLTSAGRILGTPLYMSPEQAAGDRDLDGRSDLYSLAAVGYELLTGKPPFSGTTASEVVRQHLIAPLPSLPDAVSPQVRDLLSVSLAKTREARPADARVFSQALSAPRHPTRRKGLARHRIWLLGLTAVMLAAVALIIGQRLVRQRGIPWLKQVQPVAEGFERICLGNMCNSGYETASSLPDGSILMTRPGLAWRTDGHSWHPLQSKSPVDVNTVSQLGDTVFVGLYGGYGYLVADSVIQQDSLPVGLSFQVTRSGAWSFGEQGKIRHLTSSGWVREPTGTSSYIRHIIEGAAGTIFALSAFNTDSITDSVLVRGPSRWVATDIREGRPGNAIYWDGIAVGDTVIVAGSLCQGSRCRAGLWVKSPSDRSWRETLLELPGLYALSRIWSVSGSRYGLITPCQQGSECMVEIQGPTARIVAGPKGVVLWVGLLDKTLSLVDASGVLWSLIDGKWIPLARGPSGFVRDIVDAPLLGSMLAVGDGMINSRRISVGWLRNVRRAVSRDTTVWLLDELDSLRVITCDLKWTGEFQDVSQCRFARKGIDHPRPTTDLLATRRGVLLSGPAGVVSLLPASGGPIVSLPLPPEAATETIQRLVQASGDTVFAISARNIFAWSGTAWHNLAAREAGYSDGFVRIVWAGIAGPRLLVLSQDSSREGWRLEWLDRPSGTWRRVSEGKSAAAAAVVLPDDRVAVAIAPEGDPTVGGWLEILPLQAEQGRRATVLRLPYLFLPASLGVDSSYLYVGGSGLQVLRYPLTRLASAGKR
jgi:serine/threonine protein kinase